MFSSRTMKKKVKPGYIAFRFIHEYEILDIRSQRKLSFGPDVQGFKQNHLEGIL